MSNESITKFCAPLIFTALLSACSSLRYPEGQENSKTFTQQSALTYKESYRLIAMQMRACYDHAGLMGGPAIYADLDTEQRNGVVQYYFIGFMGGAQKQEDFSMGRTITIRENPQGSVIVTTGIETKFVYLQHLQIADWLEGKNTCGYSRRQL